MKQIIVSCFFAVFAFLFMSCNSEEPPKEEVQKSSPILTRLDTFNDSLIQATAPSSRGWLDVFEAISIVVADGYYAYEGAKTGGAVGTLFGPGGTAIGATIGGVVAGAAGSYSAYHVWKFGREVTSIFLLQLPQLPL